MIKVKKLKETETPDHKEYQLNYRKNGRFSWNSYTIIFEWNEQYKEFIVNLPKYLNFTREVIIVIESLLRGLNSGRKT